MGKYWTDGPPGGRICLDGLQHVMAFCTEEGRVIIMKDMTRHQTIDAFGSSESGEQN